MSKLTREIIEIGSTVPQSEKKVRVAAYARVSSDSEEQLHSFTSQVNYYTELAKEKESWSWVGIYADEGISGISTTFLEYSQRWGEELEKLEIENKKSGYQQKEGGATKEKLSWHLNYLNQKLAFTEEILQYLSNSNE